MFGGRRERKMMLRGSAKVVTYAIFRYWKSIVGSSGDQMFTSCHSRSQKISVQIFDCDHKCSQELKSFGSDFWEVLKRTPVKLLCASNDGKVEWNTTCCILQNMQRQSWPLIGCIFKAWDKIQYVIVWYFATQINTWCYERSSRLIRNLSNCEREAWKKFRLQRDSNPWPLRYRCSALPTELWSHNCWEQVNFSGSIMPLRVIQTQSQINTIWYNTILYIIFSSAVTVTNTELWLALNVFSDHVHGNILTCCCFPKFLKILKNPKII